MTKRVFLVDTENVNTTWKELLPLLTKNDRMILFYTPNSPRISYTDLLEILQYPDRFEMMECYTGNNALDFQLISYLGYLLKTAPKTEHIIVSNDTGYDPALRFWQDRERNISRLSSKDLFMMKKAAERTAQENTESRSETSVPSLIPEEGKEGAEQLILARLGADCAPEVSEWILEMLSKYGPQKLSEIHEELQKKFGAHGSELYKMIRPALRMFYSQSKREAVTPE